ncbi:MAG: RidA family protein [Candidatus Marinimicrobia bacterium]|jgi:enamine deaminase RidA (YjgF/YER057c/UK114 family)|nr:RidA family protein [Candidatus Neomarinimicrobiota bacterium]
MHLFEENIKNLGLNIPELPKALANYVPYKIVGKTMYISGQAPVQNGELIYKGKVGSDVTVEDGIKAARLCVTNIIAAVKTGLEGDWDKLDSFVKLTGFVNCQDDFTDQPKIINGASDMLVEIFGDQGRHARVAVGSNALPLGISVEIDAIVQLK